MEQTQRAADISRARAEWNAWREYAEQKAALIEQATHELARAERKAGAWHESLIRLQKEERAERIAAVLSQLHGGEN
jgi:hypothetical protein